MGEKTGIEWTDATWNPVGGCSVHSPGCKHCYAMKLAGTRLKHHPLYAGTTTTTKAGPVFNGAMTALADDHARWLWPVLWRGAKNPVRGPGARSLIFVGDMADLFHAGRPRQVIDRTIGICAVAQHHDHQILTKRSDVMADYLLDPAVAGRIKQAVRDLGNSLGDRPGDEGIEDLEFFARIGWESHLEPCHADCVPPCRMLRDAEGRSVRASAHDGAAGPPHECRGRLHFDGDLSWPAGNIWAGFSAERQAEFDARWPDMRRLADAGWRIFVSIEPMLERIVLPADFLALAGQVICGGLSGSDESPLHPDCPRALRDQCQAAGVPFFFKQWGEWAPELAAGDHRCGVYHRFDDHACLQRVGKKAAGRLLDGREWSEIPA